MPCSHVGGHRFAPVMLTLPTGVVHGRVGTQAAGDVIRLADDGEVLVSAFRGRTGLLAPHQVAAIEVRERFGIEAMASALAEVYGHVSARTGWPTAGSGSVHR